MSSSVICALLLVCVSLIECQDFPPPCPKCKYTPGHAFMWHFRKFCRTYFECMWNEGYKNNSYYTMTCCNPREGLIFKDTEYPPGCYKQPDRVELSRSCNPGINFGCPPPIPSACPLRASNTNKRAYQIQEFGAWIDVTCPEPLVYSQALCTCIFPPPDIETCGLLIDFDFNLNVLSLECGGWTTGQIIGDAFIVQGYLCFHEYGEFLGISKLQEWFESSLKKQFTLSFRFIYDGASNSTAGLFSANCLWRYFGSPVELLIVDSELAVVLGEETKWNKTGVEIFPHEWYHIAVTYYHGNYSVYLNAEQVYEKYNNYTLTRTFTHSTLGYVEEDLFFHGCVDDFLFYTDALNQTQLYQHYTNATIRNFNII